MRGQGRLILRWAMVFPVVAVVIFLGSKPLEIPSSPQEHRRELHRELYRSSILTPRLAHLNSEVATIVSDARSDRKSAIDHLLKLRLELTEQLEEQEAMMVGKDLPEIALERAQAFREMVERRLDWLEERIAAGALEEAEDSVSVWTAEREPVALGAKQPGIRIIESQEHRPEMSPRIRPAHGGVGGDPSPMSGEPGRSDTSETMEIEFTEILEELAATLDHDVRKILEYVQGTIRYEPYRGSMKGAEETYLTGVGNDVDQASLMMALLRISGIPCRYVEGVIRLKTERVLSWLGVQTPVAAARAFGLGGIAYEPIAGNGPGGISDFDIDHVWVEAYIPMQNYRGAPGDGRGTIWVPMAPAIKELEVSGSVNIIEEMTASGTPFEPEGFFDVYIESLETRSPVAVFEDSMVSHLADAHPGMSIEQAKRTFEIKRKSYPILPLTLPAKILVVRGEYDECPSDWRYQVEVKAYSGSDTLLSVTLPLPQVGTRRVVMAFEPETEDDAIAIVEYGGVYNVPAYLVRVTPVFRVAGETVGEGVGGIGLGCRYRVGWRVTGPKGELVDLEMEKTAGMQWGVGFVSGQVPGTLYRGRRDPEDQESPQGRELHEVVMRYWEGAWAGYERFGELWWTWMLHEPDVIVSSTQLGVEQVFGQPVGVSWQGLYINVHLAIGMVELDAVVSDRDQGARGVALVATGTASWMEHRIFEEKYKVSAISAVKVLKRALEQGKGVYDIDECNVNEQLAIIDLPSWAENQIRDYVSAGYKAKVPGGQVAQDDWTGVGYVFWKDRGSACYLLQGTRGGGETTDDFDWGGWLEFWLNYYGAPLHPVGLCSTSMEWISPPDSSVWAWGDTIPVVAYDTLFYWCGGVGSGRDTTIRGPDTTWVYSGTCDPKLYHLIPVNYGPDPPGSENEPCWHLGEDSLAVWVVKVEIDEVRSDRILDVPVDENDEAEVPSRTVFRILPDSLSSECSFVHSPAAEEVKYWHYVTYQGEGGAVIAKAEVEFELDTLVVSDWRYTLHWEQKDDSEQWFDPEHNPHTSHIAMRWTRDEGRQEVEYDDKMDGFAAGQGLIVILPDETELPEAEEQDPGSGVYVGLNHTHPTGTTLSPEEQEEVVPLMVRMEVRLAPEDLEQMSRLPETCYLELEVSCNGAGKIKVWKKAFTLWDAPMEVLIDGFGLKRWHLNNAEEFIELAGILANGLWVEGSDGPSGSLKDWSMELRLRADEQGRAKRDLVQGTSLGIDLFSISGEDELGLAKVLGTIAPTVTVGPTRTLINGIERASDAGGWTAGDFLFWIDQDWLSYGDNAVVFEIDVDAATCSGSFTANVEGKAKTASDGLGGVLLCGGLGVTRWIDREYSAFYNKVTYSIAASGRIRYVRYADVFLDWRHFPTGETPIVPHQNWYNNNASGDHFIQNMGLPDPPAVHPPRTTVKQARTFQWTEPEGLKANAKCTSYILEDCPATPVLNAEVEVDIND